MSSFTVNTPQVPPRLVSGGEVSQRCSTGFTERRAAAFCLVNMLRGVLIAVKLADFFITV